MRLPFTPFATNTQSCFKMKFSPFISSILDYIESSYGAVPDFPWENSEDDCVLRHKTSKKWFALIMLNVKRSVMGLEGDGHISVMNLKCDPRLIGSLVGRPGYHSAYHMNKEHWISILLDGTVPCDEVCSMIDLSYALTSQKKKR